MRVHLVNPSDLSFGTAVITPRWLYVLAAATPRVRRADDRGRDPRAVRYRSVASGDVVGIGIHTSNALRGYTVGRLAREARSSSSAAFTRRCSRTKPASTARPTPWSQAMAITSGETCWPTARRNAAEPLRRRTDRGRRILPGALGPAARRSLHVGLGADRARLPEALLVLLGLAHRRAEAAAAAGRRRRSGNRRPSAQGIPIRPPRRRQLLSRHAGRSGGGRAPRRQDQLEALDALRQERFELMAQLERCPTTWCSTPRSPWRPPRIRSSSPRCGAHAFAARSSAWSR